MAKLVSAIVAGVLACGLVGTTALAKEDEKKEVWVPVENKANCSVWEFPLDKGETGTWKGECHDGKAEGKGVLTWRGPTKDGKGWATTFTGTMKGGKPHGEGYYDWGDGEFYKGGDKDGLKHGYGVIEFFDWMDGPGKYEGEFRNGKWHGKGKFTAEWGVYEGGFKNGDFHGRGVYKYDNGNRYEGEFKDDKEHGQGVFVWKDGARYEGEYMDGKRHGHVVTKFANGNRYEGEYKDGNTGGRGTFIFPSGNECEGEWAAEYHLQGTGNGRSNGRFVKCYIEGKEIMFDN